MSASLGGGLAIRVLYIHHYGAFGGASRSLLELIRGFEQNSVVARVLTPRGSVGTIFTASRVDVIETVGISKFDHTRYSHYRGARWLVLLREIWYFPFTLAALLRARSRWPDTEIVHVNELGALPAIVLSKLLLRKPLIIHVRSVQETVHGHLRGKLVAAVLRRCADAVIAIDETVRRSLPPDVACEVIHNSYLPGGGVVHSDAAPLPKLPPRQPGTLRVGMVGNLLLLKGVRELVEAARICRDRKLAVDFVLVGGNTRRLTGWTGKILEAMGFARDVERDVRRYLAERELENTVHMVNFTPHIEQVYRGMDVVCFPSHLEAAGRPVFEAAFYGVPSIVALSDALPDTFIEGETGLRMEPHSAVSLADAIERLCRDPAEISRMGARARALAERNFDTRKNAEKMLAVYRQVLERRPGAITA